MVPKRIRSDRCCDPGRRRHREDGESAAISPPPRPARSASARCPSGTAGCDEPPGQRPGRRNHPRRSTQRPRTEGRRAGPRRRTKHGCPLSPRSAAVPVLPPTFSRPGPKSLEGSGGSASGDHTASDPPSSEARVAGSMSTVTGAGRSTGLTFAVASMVSLTTRGSMTVPPLIRTANDEATWSGVGGERPLADGEVHQVAPEPRARPTRGGRLETRRLVRVLQLICRPLLEQLTGGDDPGASLVRSIPVSCAVSDPGRPVLKDVLLGLAPGIGDVSAQGHVQK